MLSETPHHAHIKKVFTICISCLIHQVLSLLVLHTLILSEISTQVISIQREHSRVNLKEHFNFTLTIFNERFRQFFSYLYHKETPVLWIKTLDRILIYIFFSLFALCSFWSTYQYCMKYRENSLA